MSRNLTGQSVEVTKNVQVAYNSGGLFPRVNNPDRVSGSYNSAPSPGDVLHWSFILLWHNAGLVALRMGEWVCDVWSLYDSKPQYAQLHTHRGAPTRARETLKLRPRWALITLKYRVRENWSSCSLGCCSSAQIAAPPAELGGSTDEQVILTNRRNSPSREDQGGCYPKRGKILFLKLISCQLGWLLLLLLFLSQHSCCCSSRKPRYKTRFVKK